MKLKIYIGSISGIRIYIHWTFFILLIVVARLNVSSGQNAFFDALNAVAFLSLIFLCVVLHELGHALTAKHYNFRTHDIILLPIGGVARMEGLPEKPRHEFLVAIAGPLVNVLISGMLYLFIFLDQKPDPALLSGDNINASNFWFLLLSANLALVIFNLIPAFPMDGGRVLRAALASRMSRVKATRIAARTGQVISVLLLLVGLFFNPMLILIALFVFLGAEAELQLEEKKSGLQGVRVDEILIKRYSTLECGDKLEKAVQLLLSGQEQCFAVNEAGVLTGTLSRKNIIAGLSRYGNQALISQVMKPLDISLDASAMLATALQKLTGKTDDLVPVFEGGKLVGMLDIENISEYLMVKNALEPSRV